jgi:PAS domain S-box-containing protein
LKIPAATENPAPSAGPKLAARPEEAAGSNGFCPAPETKVNILLVDDRSDKLLALEAVLSGLNQNLFKARSGKEALRYLLNQEFAIILLDVSMPGMDGFETAALIRQRPRSEHTPIIFVTSINESENHIAQGYSLGAVDYVLSPIVPEILKAKVSVFVELYKKTEQVKAQAEQLRRMEEAAHKKTLAAAVDRLEAETKRNRFFVLSVDMLAIANFDGYFLQINPVWEKTLGFTEEELKAKSGLELVHRDDRAAMAERIEILKQGASTTYFEARYRRKDGSYCWLGWTAAPFVSERLLYIFARDITARKEAETQIGNLNTQLNQRVEELTQINRELEAFSYSISHDLRAPLRAMQGFAQALHEEFTSGLEPEAKDYTKRIISAASYMDKLLEDLLEYSRLSHSEILPSTVSLDDTFNELIDYFKTRENGAVPEIQIVQPLHSIRGHLPTLRQILMNLVANAVKFVDPSKTPTVRIWSREQTGRVTLWIEDNGIGIAPEHQERIFKLFERLHGTNAYPGTGVGLALVRKGAERMNGRVGVESERGQGSRFWVELPGA